jgi:hypothetical protein
MHLRPPDYSVKRAADQNDTCATFRLRSATALAARPRTAVIRIGRAGLPDESGHPSRSRAGTALKQYFRHRARFFASILLIHAFLLSKHRYSGAILDRKETRMLRGGLLWLLGIPLPIILLLWFFGVFH